MNVEFAYSLVAHLRNRARLLTGKTGESVGLRHRLMGDWIQRTDCGTFGCIAGEARMLGDVAGICGLRSFEWAEHDAKNLLGIDGSQAYRLFYTTKWPSKYYERHEHLLEEYGDIREMIPLSTQLELMADVLENFIVTDGWQGVS